MLEKAVFFAEYETVNSTGTSGIKYYPHIKKIIPWCRYIINYVSPCDRGGDTYCFQTCQPSRFYREPPDF